MRYFILQKQVFITVCSFIILLSCKPTADPASNHSESAGDDLKNALTFYASFDEGFTADYAKGDPVLYTTKSWNISDELTAVTGEEGLVERLESGGRTGGALRFSTDWNPVVFFKGEENVTYKESDWAGSFSFWLRIDPAEGLEPGYSDPFIISDKNWDNASFYVDFTEDTPRHFRFAAFPDKEIWNPENIGWEAVPVDSRPMVDLAEMPFSDESWVHVVLVYSSVNAGSTGQLDGYLNGTYVGTKTIENLQISWQEDQVLMAIGRHYAGDFDDLAVFNRVLTAQEIQQLYNTPLIDLF